MKQIVFIFIMAICSYRLFAATENEALQREVQRLKEQTQAMEIRLNHLQKKMTKGAAAGSSHEKHKKPKKLAVDNNPPSKKSDALPPETPVTKDALHSSPVTVNALNGYPASVELYPTALMADGRVVTFIAGTPVVTSPYLGARPAYDGSDYIVNISSINRDVRLMEQRRRLYKAYERMGYPIPNMPIVTLSGKIEPAATINDPYQGQRSGDITLGSGELDVAAALNDKVEGYLALAYDESPPDVGGQRLSNSAIGLNLGFVNIGDLDEYPYYFTAGQIYVPYGRFSSAMVSAPLTMVLARTKARPVILGYKSQADSGPFAAVYGYNGDTTSGGSGVGGVNLGYTYALGGVKGEVGGSYISSIDDSGGMQFTGSTPGTTFAGFSSITNGSEAVRRIPAAGVHGTMAFDRYILTAEWVGTTARFRPQDLSFNGLGAKPQAAQLEAGVTFDAFNKPASIGLGYQWSKETLALNLPQHRLSGVFNISIWKDTVESLEYRHDVDFNVNQYANGAAPINIVNANTVGTGRASDTLLLQIGVYF